jgi:hypothetical protein
MGKRDVIDEETGMIDVYGLLPNQGDSVLIVNCGSHFELRASSGLHYPAGLTLTAEEIERLKERRIVWH